MTQGTQTRACNNLEGWDGEGTRVYPWLIHVVVWQKPTQYYKAMILQLKINEFNYKQRLTTSSSKATREVTQIDEVVSWGLELTKEGVCTPIRGSAGTHLPSAFPYQNDPLLIDFLGFPGQQG